MKEGGRGGDNDKATLLFTSSFGLQNLPSGWNLSGLKRSPCLPCWAIRATCSLQEVMGIPSFLAFPAAWRNRAHCTPWHPWGHMLLWTALLFLGESGAQQGQWIRTMARWASLSQLLPPGLGLSWGKDEGHSGQHIRQVRRVKAG